MPRKHDPQALAAIKLLKAKGYPIEQILITYKQLPPIPLKKGR